MNLSVLLLLISVNQIFCFHNYIPIKSYTRSFKNDLQDIKVTEPYYISKDNTTAIVFFTGGSSSMIPEIYQDFLKSLSNSRFSIYSPSFQYKNINLLINELSKEYKDVVFMGHSSGGEVAINNCYDNKIIKSVILIDPVDPNILTNKEKKELKYLRNIIFLNAMKSYKWNFKPFGPPFIPFKKLILDENKMNITKKCTIKKYVFEKYGHCDILDKSYSDLMHYSKLSVGNTNRSTINFNVYHNQLANIITHNINSKKNSSNYIS